MTAGNDEELRELLALEAVGALSDTERAELDDAIEGRPELRAELESLRGAAATMAEAVSEQPPPSLRARVLETIATTPQEPALPAPESDAAPESSPWPLSSPSRRRAATAGCDGVRPWPPPRPSRSACWWCPRSADDDAGDHVADVLEDPNATTIELTGELSGLRLVHSEAANATVLEGTDVPAPEGDDVFELWRIAGATPEPIIREFRPEDGMVVELMEGVDPGDDVFAITIEPPGGSDEPTSEPIAMTA